jgi:hypothetical protein
LQGKLIRLFGVILSDIRICVHEIPGPVESSAQGVIPATFFIMRLFGGVGTITRIALVQKTFQNIIP